MIIGLLLVGMLLLFHHFAVFKLHYAGIAVVISQGLGNDILRVKRLV